MPSVRPSDVYSLTKEEALDKIKAEGYRVVDFRIPKRGEAWLNSGGIVVHEPDKDPYEYMSGPSYKRLILRRI